MTVSVMSARFFKSLKDKGQKTPHLGALTSASSNQLDVTDRRYITFSYKGKNVEIPVYVCKNLNEEAIAGMDLINALGICYDPRIQSFISAIADEAPSTTITSNSDIYLRPWEAKTMRLRLSNWASTDHTAIVDVLKFQTCSPIQE